MNLFDPLTEREVAALQAVQSALDGLSLDEAGNVSRELNACISEQQVALLRKTRAQARFTPFAPAATDEAP